MTRLLRIISVGLLAATLGLGAAVAARAETLTDALISAYRNSGLLEQNRALLRAADEDVAQALASMRPVLNYAISGNYSSITDATTSNIGLSAQMLLFDFGRAQTRREIAKENVLALRDALVGVEQNVLLRAVAAYTSVQGNSAIVSLRNNNLKLIEQELQAAQDRFEVGEVTSTDVALAQAAVASARSALAAAMGNLATAREEYKAAVGHYPQNLAPTPRLPATANGLEAARAVALRRHPDIGQAQHSVRIAELNGEIARAGMLPTLSGSANLGVSTGGFRSHSFGVQLSGPIYQGGAIASTMRQAAARADAGRAGLHLTMQAVDQNVGNAWAQLTVATAGLSATEEQIRAARVAFRGVRDEAALGARTTLDVLNAEQQLLDAESAQISAQTSRYLAGYNLLSAMGLLTAEHLGLGIVTYDPAAYYNTVQSAPLTAVSPQGKKLDAVLKSLGKK